MSAVTTSTDSRFLLRGIRWDTYERMLADVGDGPVRMTYDRGDLEVMTPSHRHEAWKTLAARLIEAMTEELSVPIKSGGSTTFRRRDLQRGLEPDECYWVQSEPRVRGRYDLDLRHDPAPDLVFESEASRSVLDRLAILAALGVGEVWRFDGERLIVLVRSADGVYVESTTSQCFPWLAIAELSGWLLRAGDTDETTWIRAFRVWVRETLAT